MIEVVIAGVILVSTMTAVAQMSVSALAGSKNLSYRAKLEASINNDIQLLQKADSYLTYEIITSKGEEITACQNPTTYLKNHLTEEIDTRELEERGITRTMDVESKTDVVEVSYQFEAPENRIAREYRVIELNPNFSAQCYTVE